MSADTETLAIYDAKAAEYAELTSTASLEPSLNRFMAALPENGAVLDLGCGPGLHAAQMAQAGFLVDAWDASQEMAALAAKHPNVNARHASFDDLLDTTAVYDGIWANFSLLHADPDRFGEYLEAIARALKPGGYFHIGMKTGTGTKRDPLGRRYTYVTREGLQTDLTHIGLTLVHEETGEDIGLDGIMAAWISMLAHAPR